MIFEIIGMFTVANFAERMHAFYTIAKKILIMGNAFIKRGLLFLLALWVFIQLKLNRACIIGGFLKYIGMLL